ncbi:hypothetical protein BCU12_04155 [Vibrio sp. 10N.261.55.A7]|nr:hypothetical protein BCU12_04155 [Vibrio sp. 10N.261.55.A7]
MILNSNAMIAPICILLKSMRFWLGLSLTVVVFSLLVKLGFWQLSRGEVKFEIEQALKQREQQAPISLEALSKVSDQSALTGIRVVTHVQPFQSWPNANDVGTEQTDTVVLLDNQTYQGKVGYLAYQVVSDGIGRHFLLERGFVSGSNDRSILPLVNWVEQPQRFVGRVYQKSANPLSRELGFEETSPPRIQNLNIPELSKRLGIELESYAFQPQMPGWPYAQPWQPLPMYSAKHFGYAVQWFSMAFVFASLCLYVLIRALKLIRHNANSKEPTKLKIKEINHKDMI